MGLVVGMVAFVALFAAAAIDGAVRLRRAERRTGLLCLRLGWMSLIPAAVALLGNAILWGTAEWIRTFRPEVDPAIPLPTLWIAVGVVLTLMCVFAVLGNAAVGVALLWEYGRAAAWWRTREELPRWTRRRRQQPAARPLPPESQSAASRPRALTITLGELGVVLGMLVGDGFVLDQLRRGSAVAWAITAVVLGGPLVLVVLAAMRGTRSDGGTLTGDAAGSG